jgi:hypothetical protein
LGVALVAGSVLALLFVILYKKSLGFIFSCGHNDASCMNNVAIVNTLYWGYFIKSILITSLILLFFPERAFKWWRWFAIVSIPLFTWWMIPPGGDFFGRQAVDKVSAFLFLVVSILIAISATTYNYLKLRGKK